MGDSNYSSGNSDTASKVLRGHWRPDEDEKLRQLVLTYGARNWNTIAESIEGRTGKSCRLRWFNQLNPLIKKEPFSKEEEDRLIEAHNIHGNKWSTIASLFPGRTDNALKNHFHVVTARRRREEMRSPGPLGAFFQKPSDTRSHNPLRNSSHFRGFGTPYPFQYPPTLSNTLLNDTPWRVGSSSSAVQTSGTSNSFGFTRMMIEATAQANNDNYVFLPKHSKDGIGSWMASGSSSLVPAPDNYQPIRLLGLGTEQATPPVEKNHNLFTVSGSGTGKVGQGSWSALKDTPPFIDFLGVGDKY